MRPVFLPALSIALLSVTLATSAATPKHRASAAQSRTTHAQRLSAHSTTARGRHVTRAAAAKPAAAHIAMDPERATAIQTALIKNGYLSGEASGNWDAESVAAMQKMQSENGWQTKMVPDSRALIKLGLGPHTN